MIVRRSLGRVVYAMTCGLLVAGMAGCASVDFDYPRVQSTVINDTAETRLAEKIIPIAAVQPAGYSGFHPLADGIDALAARLLLAERAEKSIDVQYYLIKNDLVGRVFLKALLNAADRGVRVRLLLDDILTSGYDTGMLALDAHPNFEVRIFNPFNRGAAGRTLGAAASFKRINRRMHNKSFTVDNQITIIGGRNIADEYFGAREDAKFGDLDVVGIGPVVSDVSSMFDSYWNHETALPVLAFAKSINDPQARLNNLRNSLKVAIEDIKKSRYAEVLQERIFEQVEQALGEFTWAPYALVYDSPDKGVSRKAKEAGSIVTSLAEALTNATSEAVVVSPYFVPRKDGIEAFSALQERGVNVTIITNSLAANNQFTVHGGYAPSRKPLLLKGVSIYEVRPDARVRGAEYVEAEDARATLHTKAFIVDRKRVFIGSFNFDPRSANINTEMGVIIDDVGLATYFVDRVEKAFATEAYKVFLNDQGKVRWQGTDGGHVVIYDKEPETTWWQRFKAGFVRVLPIRGQL